MGLIDLQTNLKTLKFGNDQRGGGNSGLPYIKFPIEDSYTKDPYKKYYDSTRGGLDFPIRGGTIDFTSTNMEGTSASNIDKERIAKFFKDDPRGPSFLRKQVGLQLSNPKVQTAEALPSFKIAELPGLIENTRIYNMGRNTLTQVQYAGTGVHVNRAGSIPFNPLEKFYAKTMEEEKLYGSEVTKVNRLLILQKLKLSGRGSDPLSTVDDFSMVNKLGISLDRNQLFQYLGGPGSVYGVGSTVINRSSYDTTQAIDSAAYPMTTLAMSYDKIMAKTNNRVLGSPPKDINDYGDFRDDIDEFSGDVLPNSEWGLDKSMRRDNRFFDGRVDKINTLPLFKFNSDNDPWSPEGAKDLNDQTVQDVGDRSDDIIKFVFECISNDGEDKDVAIFFRAYLDQITDNNTAAWNGFKYMGRGENFYTYQGFDRGIQSGFRVAIGSKQELANVYDKVNYLISQTYPDYNLNTNFMRAPLIRLTIGDLYYRLPGYLENVNVTFDQVNSWEIDPGLQLPRYMSISFSFKPIMNTLPQRGRDAINLSKFLAEPIYKTGYPQTPIQ